MGRALDWQVDGPRWPHAANSRFVEAAGLRFHVQHFPPMADGAPVALLLHGTGASSHSMRGLAPLLQAQGFEVVVPDLPGHAFTGLPPEGLRAPQLSLPGMAQAVHALLRSMGLAPALLVGHSAGAAVALRMVLDGLEQPRGVVAINGALLPWRGAAARIFSPAARLLAAVPGVPDLFSWRAAKPSVLAQLLDGTGSRLDDEGRALYAMLVQDPGHVAGALGMMSHWDLEPLADGLSRLRVPLLQLVGSIDRTVPPYQAGRVADLLPAAARAGVIRLDGLGHLAHEEAPALVATKIEAAWRQWAGAA